MTNNQSARPCSSPARPSAGDDHSWPGRPRSVPPTGTTRPTESKDTHPHDPCSSHQKGTTTPLLATCPTHGRQTFLRCEQADLWICPISPCLAAILAEHITPDGADVVDLADRGFDELARWIVRRFEAIEGVTA